VYAAGPVTFTANEQAPACGDKTFAPVVVGVPDPFNVTLCVPVVAKVPVFEKVIPPTVLVVSVKVPGTVTFTETVTVLEASNGVPDV
jgi:hypothetical protein